MNVIREARGKSPKTRDEATNKSADLIAKRDAEEVVSSDGTDGVYFSNEELFEQMKQKADSLQEEKETDSETDDLKYENHENSKRKNEAENTTKDHLTSPETKEGDLKTSNEESLKLEKDKKCESYKNVKTATEEIDLTMSGDNADVKGKDSDKTEEPKTNQVVSDAKAVGIAEGGGVGIAGAGVGMAGAGVSMAGAGVGMAGGAGVSMAGAGVGMAGASVGMAGGVGVGMDGAGVGMAGAGVGRGVFGTGAKELSESDGGSDCSDVDQEALESGISDMESGDEEDEESADTEDNDDNDTNISFMNPQAAEAVSHHC